MARKKKRNNTQKQTAEENLEPIVSQIEQVQAEVGITEEELNKEKVEVSSTQLQVRNVKSAFEKATKIVKVLEKKESEQAELVKKLNDEKQEYEKKKEELTQKLADYDKELQEINELRIGNLGNIIDKKVIDRYSESLNDQANMLMEEIEKLKGQQTEYLQLVVQKENEILEQNKEFEKRKNTLEAEFHQKSAEKEVMLQKEEARLKKLQRQLQIEQEDFEEEKQYLEDKAEKNVENRLDQLEEEILLLKKKNEALTDEIEELEELERYFGGRDPKRTIDDLNEAKDKIYDLQSKLDISPDSLNMDELRRLRNEKIEWQTKLEEALADSNEYKQRWAKEQISIGEKETLKFQKEELQKRIELQQIALDEFQLVLDKSNAIEVFSACIEMDNAYKTAEDIDYPNKYFSQQWITAVQQKLAKRSVPLYYDENVIRSFVSGLAMSRLNILQGISGTGKTSLPEAFAEAIGGHFQTIEVQSGWKDRQDLIGYYNTFEKKFYESDFLKALYKANTPYYRNKPFFIILDEMNLSHPEHYFADLLSLMEKTNFDDQKLKICDKVSGKPDLMINEDGTYKLHIPDNVWFIGTANHDETTLQFAPKTYDRANVMEMPKNHNTIELEEDVNTDYILTDNTMLLSNFDLDDSNDVFQDYLSQNGSFKALCNKLGIGWGNRLEKQLNRFIPVFIQLGGTKADAMDHIISSKILRNIQGRYDLQEQTLNEMKEELENNFTNIFGDFPEKCLEIINQELEKK